VTGAWVAIRALPTGIIYVVFLLLLAGCQENVATIIGSQSLTMQLYVSGHLAAQKNIGRYSSEHDKILEWAERNSDDWTLCLCDEVPANLLFGANFPLNVSDTKTVLTYDAKSFQKKISPEEFRFLKETVFHL
jgi:hypothetical protein